jgi:hypothetical protein
MRRRDSPTLLTIADLQLLLLENLEGRAGERQLAIDVGLAWTSK